MDPEAFDSLVQCITEGSFDVCEAVPQGDSNGFFANSLGGISVEMAGPAGYVSVERLNVCRYTYEAAQTRFCSTMICRFQDLLYHIFILAIR